MHCSTSSLNIDNREGLRFPKCAKHRIVAFIVLVIAHIVESLHQVHDTFFRALCDVRNDWILARGAGRGLLRAVAMVVGTLWIILESQLGWAAMLIELIAVCNKTWLLYSVARLGWFMWSGHSSEYVCCTTTGWGVEVDVMAHSRRGGERSRG